MNDKPDFSTTQKFFIKHSGLASILRKSLTPGAIWAAIGVLGTIVGALIAAVFYVGNAQNRISQHQESITDLQATRQQDRELLQKIDTQLAVMNSKIGDIATEVDRQREWRERIEDVAEAPPHARRHK